MTKDPRIDHYIAKSAPFAKPVLKHVRKLMHKASPEVDETIKWGMPHFEHAGRTLGHMAAFKHHCSVGFWHSAKLKSLVAFRKTVEETAMGALGRVTRLEELPSDRVFLAAVKEAIQLAQAGVKLSRRTTTKKGPPKLPSDLSAALRKARALGAFEALSSSHQREYVEWIAEAKQAATRARRIKTTIEWVLEGKSRNWKYERKHRAVGRTKRAS